MKKASIVQVAFEVAIPIGAKITIKNAAVGEYPTIEKSVEYMLAQALKDAGITATPRLAIKVVYKTSDPFSSELPNELPAFLPMLAAPESVE